MRSVIRNHSAGLTKRSVYTSKTGFQNALGESSSVYLGGTLDAKVKNSISSLAQSGVMYASNGGPAYGILWIKVSASYYGGNVFGYRDKSIVQFAYEAGTYTVVMYE